MKPERSSSLHKGLRLPETLSSQTHPNEGAAQDGSEQVTILFISDIVGKPGRRILRDKLPSILKTHRVDFCIANGENAAGGVGITQEIMEELFQSLL